MRIPKVLRQAWKAILVVTEGLRFRKIRIILWAIWIVPGLTLFFFAWCLGLFKGDMIENDHD